MNIALIAHDSKKSLMIEKNNKGEGTITLDDTYKVYKY